MKRIPPTVWKRIRTGWKWGLTFFVSLCTVGGFMIPLLGIKITGQAAAAIAATVVMSAIFVAYYYGKSVQLPMRVVDELSMDKHYTVSYCNSASLREADEMTRPFFRNAFVPFDRIEQWRMKNGRGFVAIHNETGELCACFVIIGLAGSFLDQFITGNVVESQIDGNIVLPYEEMIQQNRIYISGVVVKDAGSHLGCKRAKVMIWVMLKYIQKMFGIQKTRTFYALSLTHESEKLLHTMGFQQCCDKSSRMDDHDFYSIVLDTRKWKELNMRTGDYSQMVTIRWD